MKLFAFAKKILRKYGSEGTTKMSLLKELEQKCYELAGQVDVQEFFLSDLRKEFPEEVITYCEFMFMADGSFVSEAQEKLAITCFTQIIANVHLADKDCQNYRNKNIKISRDSGDTLKVRLKSWTDDMKSDPILGKYSVKLEKCISDIYAHLFWTTNLNVSMQKLKKAFLQNWVGRFSHPKITESRNKQAVIGASKSSMESLIDLICDKAEKEGKPYSDKEEHSLRLLLSKWLEEVATEFLGESDDMDEVPFYIREKERSVLRHFEDHFRNNNRTNYVLSDKYFAVVERWIKIQVENWKK